MKLMLSRLKLTLVAIIAAGAVLFPAVAFATTIDCNNPPATGLTPQQAIQCGTSGAAGSSTVDSNQTGAATDSFNHIVSSILNILTVVVGILAVVMIVLAGSRFITSGGNQEKVASARRALIYAVIGIVIAALAQIITQFVLEKATTAQSSASGQCVLEGAKGYVNSVTGQPCTP